jgi:hypothetical protein
VGYLSGHRKWDTYREVSDTRKLLTLEKLKGSSTSGGDVGQLVLNTILLGDSSGVSSSNDDGGTLLSSLNSGVKSSLSSVGELVELENTGRTVPEDSLSLRNSLLEEITRLLSTVKSLPSIGDSISVGSVSSVGVLGELVGGDVVNRKDNLDVVLLSLLDEVTDGLGSCLIEEGVSDSDTLKSLLEGESHSSSNDQGVNLGDKVVDQLDLVGDLSTSEDSEEGTLGVLESLGEVLKLLLDEESGSPLGEVNSDYGRVSTVSSSESIVDVDVSKGSQRATELLDGLGGGLDLVALGILGGSLLLGVETKVLKENDLSWYCEFRVSIGEANGGRELRRVGGTVGSLSNVLLNLLSDTVVQEGNGLVEEVLELLGDGSKRVLLNDGSVGTSEVGHQDDGLSTIVDGVLDGGESTDDTLVVGDGGSIEGDVEVDLEGCFYQFPSS